MIEIIINTVFIIYLIIVLWFISKAFKLRSENEKRLDKIEKIINRELEEDFLVDAKTFNYLYDRVEELEKKITEPKYNELMEYLDNHKMEIKYWNDIDMEYVTLCTRVKVKDFRITESWVKKPLGITGLTIRFKDKQINLHQDQIQSLFNKAEEYYKAKELMKEEKINNKKRKK